MIRLAICDDDLKELKEAEFECRIFFSSISESAEILTYVEPENLIEKHENTPFDIVILDIVMPSMSGIELAKELSKRGKAPELIFLTVSRDYAIDAFNLDATHYVLKSERKQNLKAALLRALKHMKEKKNTEISLNLPQGEIRSIDCSDIVYIESIGHRRMVHTMDEIFEETQTTLTSFLEILDTLFPGRFISPYRGYIINLEYVKTIVPGAIRLVGDVNILIKRGDFRRIKDIYFNYTFNSKGEK